MFEKLQLERECAAFSLPRPSSDTLTVRPSVLLQRIRQLENGEGVSSRPSALPPGLPLSRAVSFVQTVLGIHYEALGLHQPPERVRPVRLSALQREKMSGDMKEDSASEREPRRSSKRQRPTKGAPPPVSPQEAPTPEDGTIPLVAKSGTRIRLKPIVAPRGDVDEEGSVDAPLNEPYVVETGRAPVKRPRSPASSAQGPAKPAKKRNTMSTAARNKINIQTIPRAADGSPLLPMQVGMFTLRNLGQIVTADDLCTQKALYPIGYQCER